MVQKGSHAISFLFLIQWYQTATHIISFIFIKKMSYSIPLPEISYLSNKSQCSGIGRGDGLIILGHYLMRWFVTCTILNHKKKTCLPPPLTHTETSSYTGPPVGPVPQQWYRSHITSLYRYKISLIQCYSSAKWRYI